MRRLLQLARYATVSAIATGTSLVVLGALVATRTLTPGWANLVATAVGTVPSFELNRRWVWGRTGRRSVRAEVVPFAVLAAAGLALSTLTVVVTGRWADAAGLTDATRTLAVQAANLVGFGLVWLAQFAVCDRLLFRPTAPVPTPEAVPAGRRLASAR
ncbi:MAG: GtrA family protein [Acidimicrobiales bacterium]